MKVPNGIFETRISNRHTTLQALEVLYTEQIFILILNKIYRRIPPVVILLPVTTVQEQEEFSFISEYCKGILITERSCKPLCVLWHLKASEILNTDDLWF